MEKLITYVKLSRQELSKVIFPLKAQVKNAAVAVVAVVSVVTLFLAMVDGTMSFTLSFFLD